MKVPGKGLTISGQTYQSLRAGILGGELAPGNKIRTQEFSQRYGVSLGAVRESLSQLMAEGLVLCEAHRGYTVAPLSIEDLRDLTRVRVNVENLCLTWSMQAGQLEWESGVLAATHRLTKTCRLDDRSAPNAQWVAAHDAYHETLVGACGSPRLLRIRRQLYDQSERYRKLEPVSGRSRNADDEHRHIADAAIGRDIPLATRLMQEHIDRTTQNIIKVMGGKAARKAQEAARPDRRESRVRVKARA